MAKEQQQPSRAEEQQAEQPGETPEEQRAVAPQEPRADAQDATSPGPGDGSVDGQAATEAPGAQEAGTAAGGEPGPGEPDELTRVQAELADAREAALRAQADAQNAMRRAQQDVEKARKFALERFAGELLPVVDNLERALEAAGGDDENVKPIAEGVELTLRSFLDAMKKFGIEVVDPHGAPFDPNLHQAMSMVDNPEVEPNTVIAVMQKGYTLNGRLVRPAMVMVSKTSDS